MPKKRPDPFDDAARWSTEDLRLLASVKGSALNNPLSRFFTTLRNLDREKLLSESTDFPTTQFHRGRLAMLNDLVLLLEEEAPRAYQSRKDAEAAKRRE